MTPPTRRSPGSATRAPQNDSPTSSPFNANHTPRGVTVGRGDKLATYLASREHVCTPPTMPTGLVRDLARIPELTQAAAITRDPVKKASLIAAVERTVVDVMRHLASGGAA